MTSRVFKTLLLLTIPFTEAMCQNPSGRTLHALAYYPPENMLLVYGGHKHYKDTSKTREVDGNVWGWNGSRWQVVAKNAPPLRDDAKMVYHPRTKKLLLHGGRIGPKALDELWEWNGTTWKMLRLKTTPGPRIHSQLCYDAKRERVVLFGGIRIDEKGQSSFMSDVWEFDGVAWREVESANGPSPRFAFSMVYSSALKKSLIIGGLDKDGVHFNELWSWDGEKFELLSSGVPALESGMGNAASIKEGDKILLLCGRRRATERDSSKVFDSWLWNGREWSLVDSEESPTVRENHMMAADENLERVFLFGGGTREDAGFTSPDDLWVFEDLRWRKLN